MTLFQDGAATSSTTETFNDQALEASDTVVRKDDASILGGESDDVPSSAFIHGESDVVPSPAFIHDDDYETVEHGIFPSTTVIHLQRIYNFLLFHAIILSTLDVLYAFICYFI